jgi:RsiW-degrading membrane proteinase PrsW (M82 family)
VFFSDSIATVIIAGLLSLLPVFILLWVYYVREDRPSVRGTAIARYFALGAVAVGLAVLLERGVYAFWQRVSPETSGVFFASNIFPADLPSVLAAAFVSFLIIALIEESVRYFLMRLAMRRSPEFDQLIDGVQFGMALGLGFAFIENTIYFLELFRSLDFDTLVVVFFLRFLISTVGHMAFGGVMGYCLAHAEVYRPERRMFLRRAFLFPWLMHGVFDLLLTIQLSFYTVLLLVIPLYIFWSWWQDERLFELHVLQGRRLRFPVSVKKREVRPRPHVVEVLPAMRSCPNCYSVIGDKDTRCASCGLRLHRRGIPSLLPFLSKEL